MIITYIPNKHSIYGGFMMVTWVKENYFIAVFLIISLSFVFLFSLSHATQGDEEQVITIEHGDNLWSLADKYASGQPTSEWIDTVIKMNQLQDSNIKVGQVLKVPGVHEKEENFLYKDTQIAGSDQ